MTMGWLGRIGLPNGIRNRSFERFHSPPYTGEEDTPGHRKKGGKHKKALDVILKGRKANEKGNKYP